jgi:hypothetical protein
LSPPEDVGALSQRQVTALRELMVRYREVCGHPLNAERRRKWAQSNSLQAQPPLVWTFPDWRVWKRFLPEEEFICPEGTLGRAWENQLRQGLYHFEVLRDDHVCEPLLRVWKAVARSPWGLEPRRIGGQHPDESWHYDPPMKEVSDFRKLQWPSLSYDREDAERRLGEARELAGGVLPVESVSWTGVDTILVIHLCALRGIDQVFLDMHERPEFLHEVLSFLTEANLRLLDQAEAGGWLVLNNRDDYTGSGAMGYTAELPRADFAGRVRACDLWVHSEAQEYALVSPAHHWEFALQYQVRLLERFGLVCYGCCEALHGKLDQVLRIPRLRRISISPWCDTRIAAERLQDRYIYNWKPNPADLISGWDEDRVRGRLMEFLHVTKGCIVEMVMKDVQTLGEHPERLARWVEIARECVETVYG